MTDMTLTIDCQTCPVRGRHCADCFVPLLGRAWLEGPQPVGHPTDGPVELDEAEWEALQVFVRHGMVDAWDARGVRATLEPPFSDVG